AQLDALPDKVVEADDHLREDARLAARRPRQAAAERVARCRRHFAVVTADQHARAEIDPGLAVVGRKLQHAAVKAWLEVEDVIKRQTHAARTIRNQERLLG